MFVSYISKINVLITFIYLDYFVAQKQLCYYLNHFKKRKIFLYLPRTKKPIQNKILNCKDTLQLYLFQLMTRYLLKPLSFKMIVKIILTVIHITNIKSLVNSGSTLLNFKNCYQKDCIIVKKNKSSEKSKKKIKKTHFYHSESLFVLKII